MIFLDVTLYLLYTLHRLVSRETLPIFIYVKGKVPFNSPVHKGEESIIIIEFEPKENLILSPFYTMELVGRRELN